MAFDEAELRAALTRYRQLRDEALSTRRWDAVVDLFAPDATYRDADHGEFRGRDAILAYMTRLMAPLRSITITDDWEVFDTERGWIIVQTSYGLVDERDSTFAIWSRLVYDDDGRFSVKEDMYNAHDAFFSLRGIADDD